MQRPYDRTLPREYSECMLSSMLVPIMSTVEVIKMIRRWL